MTTTIMTLTIIGMGLITYAIRVSLFLLPDRYALPSWLLKALRYVPAAVLSAIIFPELLIVDGQFQFSLSNERLLAGLAAAVVAWRTKNVVLTVVIGMIVLWLLLFLQS